MTFVEVTGRLVDVVSTERVEHLFDRHVERLDFLPVEIDLNFTLRPTSHANSRNSGGLFKPRGD